MLSCCLCAVQAGYWQRHRGVTSDLCTSCQLCTAVSVPVSEPSSLSPQSPGSVSKQPTVKDRLPPHHVRTVTATTPFAQPWPQVISAHFWRERNPASDTVPYTMSLFFFKRTEASGATEKVRKGISDFLGVISDTFAPSPDKTIDCDVITLMATPTGTTEPYDSAKVSAPALSFPSGDGSSTYVFSSRLASTASSQTQPPTATNLTVRSPGSSAEKSLPGVGSVGHPKLCRTFNSGSAG